MTSTTVSRAKRVAIAAMFSATALILTACGGDKSTGPETPGAIRIRNDASISVYYAYFRSCGATEWGTDRLGTNTVMPGNTQSLPVAAGCYDVRVRSSNAAGKFLDKTSITIQGGQTAEVIVTGW